uniref:Uncharacterized protein n=1 Tax=Arion vulgaris TaxID=1028688 RepID=A0A0B7AXD7_9EUPU
MGSKKTVLAKPTSGIHRAQTTWAQRPSSVCLNAPPLLDTDSSQQHEMGTEDNDDIATGLLVYMEPHNTPDVQRGYTCHKTESCCCSDIHHPYKYCTQHHHPWKDLAPFHCADSERRLLFQNDPL